MIIQEPFRVAFSKEMNQNKYYFPGWTLVEDLKCKDARVVSISSHFSLLFGQSLTDVLFVVESPKNPTWCD